MTQVKILECAFILFWPKTHNPVYTDIKISQDRLQMIPTESETQICNLCSKDLNFSFTPILFRGIKTSLLLSINKNTQVTKGDVMDLFLSSVASNRFSYSSSG